MCRVETTGAPYISISCHTSIPQRWNAQACFCCCVCVCVCVCVFCGHILLLCSVWGVGNGKEEKAWWGRDCGRRSLCAFPLSLPKLFSDQRAIARHMSHALPQFCRHWCQAPIPSVPPACLCIAVSFCGAFFFCGGWRFLNVVNE